MVNIEAPIIGIERHRLASDGQGVTTLVGFWGCPLQCKYCLNPQSWKVKPTRFYTPEELMAIVSIDQLYFMATGGGVTFGGGEPLLYSDFVVAFRALCGETWNLSVETSLNVPTSQLEKIFPAVNHFIVDLKESNEAIYQSYTGKGNQQVIDNLKWLVTHTDVARITVRLPLIPGYNTEADVAVSEGWLRSLGITQIDRFTYRTDDHIDKV